jgi:hypothetical protein
MNAAGTSPGPGGLGAASVRSEASSVRSSRSGAFGSSGLSRHVSARVPIQGPGRELDAYRPASIPAAPETMPVPSGKSWKLQATLPGAVIHDISFASLTVGFAAAELGQVWKTTDGGSTWKEILNLGFPYYFYGVKALDTNNVVISGFDDSNFESLIRWSSNGGSTWSNDIVLSTSGWGDRVRFIGSQTGLVMDQLNLNGPNAAHYTTDGGQGAGDWTQVEPDPNGGWFGDQFGMLADQTTQAAGITYCASANAGQSWTCGPSIDNVFDGPVFFFNDQAGWVGGGEISPNVAGWLHRTTDGGKTWSGRVLNSPFPIREIYFLSPTLGWAVGGNIYSNVGGIYSTKNGGAKWKLELNTNGVELKSCDSRPSGKKVQVWCAGFNGNLSGAVYTTTLKVP